MKAYTRLLLGVLFLALAAWVATIPASQSTHAAGPWYVAPGGSDGNDCLSSTTACATINGALNKPGFVAGDTVLVAIGTYTGTSDQVVLLDKNATLSGGWDAGFTTQNGTSTIDGEGARRGITVNSGITVIVERFAVQNGYVGDYCDGGGIYNSGTLTLNNTIISGNTANRSGGGIRNDGTLILNNSSVSGNTTDYGGGIYNLGTLTLNNSSVSGNTAIDGGGIYNGGTLTLNNSTVSGNTANGAGGGIHGGIVTLNNSTVSGNTANAVGGGIYNLGTLTLNNSTVSGNTAIDGGGGIYNGVGTATLNNSTVTNNTVIIRGYGGGIGGNGALLRNSILAGNTAPGGQDCSGTVSSAGYNLVGNTSDCIFTPDSGDLTNVIAGLDSLIGSPEKPMYHPLLPGSPAIDAGNPAGCMGSTGLLTTDQRGAARVGQCDTGSYEYTTPGPVAIIYAFDGTPQRAIPFSLLRIPLQAAVLDNIGSPVNNATVTFSAPASGASGIFTDTGTFTTTVATAENGIATATTFTANGLLGNYTVTAAVSGIVTPANFLLDNILWWYVAPDGNDGNTCGSAGAACATINGALNKPGFAANDTIRVATGVYTGAGDAVVLLNKSTTLSGGWNASFTTQNGTSTIDGEGARRGIYVMSNVPSKIERFAIQNGNAGSPSYGGGIWNHSPLTLNNCIVSNNTAEHGGGIASSDPITLNNSVIYGNTASVGGGIYQDGLMTVNNSAIYKNTAIAYDGGGIWSRGALTLNSSTVSDNVAHIAGGGINSYDDTGESIVTLNNSTVANNTTDRGGGVYNTGIGRVTLQNSVLNGNTANDGLDCYGTVSSAGYNLIGNTSGCAFSPATGDLTNVDAKLGPLEGSSGYHPLLPDSPAVNGGNPAGCKDDKGNLLPTDQRGFPRFSRCDIGAYELQPIGFSTKKVDPPSATHGDLLTYTIVLTNGSAINLANVHLSDTVPISLTYVGGSLAATNGSYGYNSQVITWTGSVDAGEMVTITYQSTVTPTITLNTRITNSVVISGGGEILTRTATVTIPPATVFLPCVFRDYCPGFFDDFSNPASGWEVGEDSYARSEYLNGEFRVLTKQSGYFYLYQAPTCKGQSYIVEADAHWVGTPGSRYGLLFGITASYNQYYLFAVNTDYQQFQLLRRDPSGFMTLVSSTYSAAIHSGTASNHLKATRSGSNITLEVNGTVLGTWTDSAISGVTGAGIGTNPYSNIPVSDARFDNFAVTILPSN